MSNYPDDWVPDRNWVPCKVRQRDNRMVVEWCCLGGKRFIEPFFADTIRQCSAEEVDVPPCPETSIDVLGELCAQQPGLEPSGFIFHMSRCGSTLVSQMLAALPQNIVLSEAEPVDAVLSAHLQTPAVSCEQRITWLRWMVSTLGQQRWPQERRLFIKMDSWHTFYLPLIREAFPGTPWVFLYRDPIEIMVSHRTRPGSQMVPGSKGHKLLGLTAIDACVLSPEEYCARVLAAICQAVLDAYTPPQCLLINYQQLPEVVWRDLPRHFHFDCTDRDEAVMRRVAVFDAKHPSQRFEQDSQSKQREATDMQLHQAHQWVYPLYHRLEALRTTP